MDNVMTADAIVTWRVIMVIKSVHIKECWPFEYVAPIRGKAKQYSQASKDKINARKRELYHIKKQKQQLKTLTLDSNICEVLNNESQSRK